MEGGKIKEVWPLWNGTRGVKRQVVSVEEKRAGTKISLFKKKTVCCVCCVFVKMRIG